MSTLPGATRWTLTENQKTALYVAIGVTAAIILGMIGFATIRPMFGMGPSKVDTTKPFLIAYDAQPSPFIPEALDRPTGNPQLFSKLFPLPQGVAPENAPPYYPLAPLTATGLPWIDTRLNSTLVANRASDEAWKPLEPRTTFSDSQPASQPPFLPAPNGPMPFKYRDDMSVESFGQMQSGKWDPATEQMADTRRDLAQGQNPEALIAFAPPSMTTAPVSPFGKGNKPMWGATEEMAKCMERGMRTDMKRSVAESVDSFSRNVIDENRRAESEPAAFNIEPTSFVDPKYQLERAKTLQLEPMTDLFTRISNSAFQSVELTPQTGPRQPLYESEMDRQITDQLDTLLATDYSVKQTSIPGTLITSNLKRRN